jgi:hypothetical protein
MTRPIRLIGQGEQWVVWIRKSSNAYDEQPLPLSAQELVLLDQAIHEQAERIRAQAVKEWTNRDIIKVGDL